MISYLKGQLIDLDEGRCTVLAGQVGYDVNVGPQAMPQVGSDVELFIHWHQKTESPVLYGFLESANRTLFRAVLTIHGVGPRIALGLVSGLGVQTLKKAIQEGDTKTLGSVPGLSQKRAEKILGELREKISDENEAGKDSASDKSPMSQAAHLPKAVPLHTQAVQADDVGEALRGLGYSQVEIDGLQGQLPEASTEIRLRAALEQLGAGSKAR